MWYDLGGDEAKVTKVNQLLLWWSPPTLPSIDRYLMITYYHHLIILPDRGKVPSLSLPHTFLLSSQSQSLRLCSPVKVCGKQSLQVHRHWISSKKKRKPIFTCYSQIVFFSLSVIKKVVGKCSKLTAKIQLKKLQNDYYSNGQVFHSSSHFTLKEYFSSQKSSKDHLKKNTLLAGENVSVFS